MFVCNYDRKNFIDDHRQKYVEITKNCLGNEIADERLRFLQTKHLQCILQQKDVLIELFRCDGMFLVKNVQIATTKHNLHKYFNLHVRLYFRRRRRRRPHLEIFLGF